MRQPSGSAARSPIVVADTGDAFALLRDSLGAGLQLANATTLAQARKLIDADTPLVLCDCHFDDGRMYDLLRYLKATPVLAAVPFLAIRVQEGELDDAMYESVKIATHALGGDGFVDLFRWRMKYGEQAASRKLAEKLSQLATGSGSWEASA